MLCLTFCLTHLLIKCIICNKVLTGRNVLWVQITEGCFDIMPGLDFGLLSISQHMISQNTMAIFLEKKFRKGNGVLYWYFCLAQTSALLQI